MSPPLLRVTSLAVSYGGVPALQDVSLEVRPGQIVTVIGPNGAGKTTLLMALMGLLPHTGEIRYDGSAAALVSVESRVRAGLALVPETRELFGSMSVEDNLELGAFHRRNTRGFDMRASREEVFAQFPRLKERRGQLAHTLSGGERQMLALGRALMGQPRLLMLDEPSLGLAPLIVKEIFRMVEELRRRGVAILLVEQNARAALRAADHAYVLETGSVVLGGPAAVLAGDPRVAASYLGLGETAGAAAP